MPYIPLTKFVLLLQAYLERTIVNTTAGWNYIYSFLKPIGSKGDEGAGISRIFETERPDYRSSEAQQIEGVS